jgi:hypothetical protein
MQLALTTMVRNLDATFSLWCTHHLRLFDTILLWIDDPAELASPFLPSDPRILIQLGDQDTSRSSHGSFMLRQDANTNRALELCRARSIDWLCHLDADELLHAPSREDLLAELTPECGQIRFVNHEVWPVWEAANPFTDCTVFKVNGHNPFFHFYNNGKSAVRCTPGVSARGAHKFVHAVGQEKVSTSTVVLHYACATYAIWLNKYAHLGDFPSFWWDDPKNPIPKGFHLESRDVYQRCASTGDFAEAEAFFRATTLREDAIPFLKTAGLIATYQPIKP